MNYKHFSFEKLIKFFGNKAFRKTLLRKMKRITNVKSQITSISKEHRYNAFSGTLYSH